MPPAGEVSTGVIISDVIGKTQNIAIFSGLTRDIDDVAGRLDNAGQNATVLAPDNSVMRSLQRKPWEDPEDYDTFGASAYEGSSGEDRARKNLERFVQRHIVPESPWEEGRKIKTLAGNEIWWESKDGQKKVSLCHLASASTGSPPRPTREHIFFVSTIPRTQDFDRNGYSNGIIYHLQWKICIKSSLVRWPRFVFYSFQHLIIRSQSHSWLWRQVKVNLNTYSWSRKWRGFEYVPPLIIPRSSLTCYRSHSHQHSSGIVRYPRIFFWLIWIMFSLCNHDSKITLLFAS